MSKLIALFEAAEYKILTENTARASWLKTNYGPKILERYEAEMAANQVPAPVQTEVDGEAGADLTDKIIEFIMKHDPTPNKGYSRWIAARYIGDKGPMINDVRTRVNQQKIEDINPMLTQQLSMFQRAAAARRIDPNLDALKTFSDLYDVLRDFIVGNREVSSNMDRKTGRITKVDPKTDRVWGENDPMRSQADVVLDSDEYMVVIPKTEEAAVYFGKNTRWCTTTGHFDHYTNDGSLYIILRRSDAKRWQFHFHSDQFMDESDRQIDMNAFYKNDFPVIEAIGREKFAKLCADTYGRRISADNFSMADFESLPNESLAELSIKIEFFNKVSAKRRLMPEFVQKLFGDLNNEPNNPSLPIIIAWYVKKWPHPEAWVYALNGLPKVYDRLPDNLKADPKIKEAAAYEQRYGIIKSFIPEPWPHEVSARYWKDKSNRGYAVPSTIPEEFLTDQVFENGLIQYPNDISNFPVRYNHKVFMDLLQKYATFGFIGPKIEEVIQNTPKSFFDKTSVDYLGVVYKKTDDKKDKEKLLKLISYWPHNLWPFRAAEPLKRLATLNHDFESNPPHLQSEEDALNWIAYHHTELMKLPKQYINQATVTTALNGSERIAQDFTDRREHEKYQKAEKRRNKYHRKADYQTSLMNQYVGVTLNNLSPDHVPVELVENALLARGDIDKVYDEVPLAYWTPKLAESPIKKGLIRLSDERWLPEVCTPENIAIAVSHQFQPTHQVRIPVKDGANTYTNVETKTNHDHLKYCWELVSKMAQNVPATLKAILAKTYVGGDKNSRSHYNQSIDERLGFLSIIKSVPKSMLTADIEHAWLESFIAKQIYSADAEVKSLFKLFPEASMDAANAQLAIKAKIIDKIPDQFINDDTIISKLKNHIYGELPKQVAQLITPTILTKLVLSDPRDAASLMDHSKISNLKTLVQDKALSTAILNGTNTDDYFKQFSRDTAKKIFADPATRVNWDQHLYDLAAGHVVPLSKIPEEFRSHAAIGQSLVSPH